MVKLPIPEAFSQSVEILLPGNCQFGSNTRLTILTCLRVSYFDPGHPSSLSVAFSLPTQKVRRAFSRLPDDLTEDQAQGHMCQKVEEIDQNPGLSD